MDITKQKQLNAFKAWADKWPEAAIELLESPSNYLDNLDSAYADERNNGRGLTAAEYDEAVYRIRAEEAREKAVKEAGQW